MIRFRLVVAAAAVGLVLAGAAQAQQAFLSGQEIRELITGNTLIGPIGRFPYDFSYQPDGVVYGSIGIDTDSGTWSVSDAGVYCHEWTVHFDATRRCYRWSRAPRNRYRMVNVDRFRVRNIDVWRIKPGLQ